MDKPKKPRGRPRIYAEGSSRNNEEAPKSNIRFEPNLYRYCVRLPEGARSYLEYLVRQGLEKQGRTRQNLLP